MIAPEKVLRIHLCASIVATSIASYRDLEPISIGKQIATLASNGEFTTDEHVTYVGEFQALLGIALDMVMVLPGCAERHF